MLKMLITSMLLNDDSKFTSAKGTRDRSLMVESAEGDCCCCPIPTYGEAGVKERDMAMNFTYATFSFILLHHLQN